VWEVEYTDQFETWWDDLTEAQQDIVDAGIRKLAAEGPTLGRPLVDLIKGSRHKNMKELRLSKLGALRVLFAFDPLRSAILLMGGDKTGQWNQWYITAIPIADDLYDEHLKDINEKDT